MYLHVLDNAKTEGLTLQRFVSGIVTEQVLPHRDCGLQSSESATFAALTISTMCVSSQAHSIRTKWYEAGSRASLRPLNYAGNSRAKHSRGYTRFIIMVNNNKYTHTQARTHARTHARTRTHARARTHARTHTHTKQTEEKFGISQGIVIAPILFNIIIHDLSRALSNETHMPQ